MECQPWNWKFPSVDVRSHERQRRKSFISWLVKYEVKRQEVSNVEKTDSVRKTKTEKGGKDFLTPLSLCKNVTKAWHSLDDSTVVIITITSTIVITGSVTAVYSQKRKPGILVIYGTIDRRWRKAQSSLLFHLSLDFAFHTLCKSRGFWSNFFHCLAFNLRTLEWEDLFFFFHVKLLYNQTDGEVRLQKPLCLLWQDSLCRPVFEVCLYPVSSRSTVKFRIIRFRKSSRMQKMQSGLWWLWEKSVCSD